MWRMGRPPVHPTEEFPGLTPWRTRRVRRPVVRIQFEVDAVEGEPVPEDGVIELGDDARFGVESNRDILQGY